MSFLQSIDKKVDGLMDRAAAYIAGYKETPPPDKNRYEKVEVRGNPNKGEVVYFRQIHETGKSVPRVDVTVGMCQYQIWEELQAGKFKHVFVEGFPEDMEPGDPRRTGEEGWSLMVKVMFPEGMPKTPSLPQLFALAKLGAPFIYAYFNPDVTLHRTQYKNEDTSQRDDLLAAEFEAHPDMDPKHFDFSNLIHKFDAARETSAAREIMNYLKDNPGAKVVLVYGARHQFNDDFEKEKTPPVVVSVSFPFIANAYNRSVAYAQARKHSRG